MSTSTRMTLGELCDLVDHLDPQWYLAWCERDGTEEELRKYATLLHEALHEYAAGFLGVP